MVLIKKTKQEKQHCKSTILQLKKKERRNKRRKERKEKENRRKKDQP